MKRTMRMAAALGLAAFGAAGCGEAVSAGEFVQWRRIEVQAQPPGTSDLLIGGAGAVPAGSGLTIYGDSERSKVVTSLVANADGSFGPVEIGDNRWSAVWVEVAGFSDAGAFANDIQAPAALVTTAPPEVSSDRQGSFAFSCDEEVCSFECGIDGGAWAACSSPFQSAPLDHGEHAFRLRATDAAGNVGAASYRLWNVELEAPPIRIDEAPSDPSIVQNAIVRFSSVPGATFECAGWRDTWYACESPHEEPAWEGLVQFQVRAVLDGKRSEPVVLHWTVVREGGEIQITERPPLTDNDPNPIFAFECGSACDAVTCEVDGTPIEPCVSPVQLHDMPDGDHVFTLTSNQFGEPFVLPLSWTIDTQAPAVIFEQAPPAATRERDALFAFACDDGALCSFVCSVDGGEPTLCESPLLLEGLDEGAHRLDVRAIDWIGNESEMRTHEFQVDETAPTIVLEGTPDSTTTSTSAEFVFSCADEPCTFTCAVDLQDPEPCTSPWTLEGIAPGPRSVTIVATDRVGLTAETTWAWTITERVP